MDRILYVSHELAIEHSPAVLFVSLSKTRVLMQLSQNFIQSGYVGILKHSLLVGILRRVTLLILLLVGPVEHLMHLLTLPTSLKTVILIV